MEMSNRLFSGSTFRRTLFEIHMKNVSVRQQFLYFDSMRQEDGTKECEGWLERGGEGKGGGEERGWR